MNFDQLYQSNYAGIYSYLRTLLSNETEAQDVCQDTFVSLYREMEKGRMPDNVKAWLFRVATNKSNNLFRRQKNFREIISIREEGCNHGVEEDLILQERREGVYRAIQTLEERDRQMILLYRNDFSYKEMGEILGMNINSVGKTLSRVIEKLKKEIKTESYELFV